MSEILSAFFGTSSVLLWPQGVTETIVGCIVVLLCGLLLIYVPPPENICGVSDALPPSTEDNAAGPSRLPPPATATGSTDRSNPVGKSALAPSVGRSLREEAPTKSM